MAFHKFNATRKDWDMEYKRALVIDVGGPEGIWTGMRGEGRWCVNVALLFRKFGMEVDIYTPCSIVEEYKDKQEEINFIKEFPSTKDYYDVFFTFRPLYKDDPPLWEKIKPLAKKYIFGNFWPGVNDVRPFPNAIAVSPYRTFSKNTMVLPFTYIDEFQSSKFSNKTLIWTSRGPFNTSMGEARYEVNLYHLRATLEEVNAGHKAIFLCYAGDFRYEEPVMPLKNKDLSIEVNNILEQLKANKDVEFYDNLPQDKFLAILKRGSVAVRCDGCGSLSTSLEQGIVPTLFTTWFYPVYFNVDYIEGIGMYPHYNSVPEQEVKGRIHSLLNDEVFFNNQLALIRAKAPLSTTEQALVRLKDILEVL